jgi:hypothetical protein
MYTSFLSCAVKVLEPGRFPDHTLGVAIFNQGDGFSFFLQNYEPVLSVYRQLHCRSNRYEIVFVSIPTNAGIAPVWHIIRRQEDGVCRLFHLRFTIFIGMSSGPACFTALLICGSEAARLKSTSTSYFAFSNRWFGSTPCGTSTQMPLCSAKCTAPELGGSASTDATTLVGSIQCKSAGISRNTIGDTLDGAAVGTGISGGFGLSRGTTIVPRFLGFAIIAPWFFEIVNFDRGITTQKAMATREQSHQFQTHAIGDDIVHRLFICVKDLHHLAYPR